MVAVASAAAGAAALWAWQRTSVPVGVPQLQVSDQPVQQPVIAEVAQLPVLPQSVQDIAEPGLIDPRQNKSNDPRFKLIRRASFWQGIISIVLAAISLAAVQFGYRIVAGACLLISMALCAFMLRGPSRRHGIFVTVILIALFGIQLLAVASTAYNEAFRFTDALSLLELTLFSLCGLGIAVCLGATWLRAWRFTEPVAVGLVAVSLGAFCFPGLRYLTEGIIPLYNTGSALLYATGNSDQKLQLEARIFSLRGSSESETLQISNFSNGRVRWALLVSGGARIDADRTISPDVRRTDLTVPRVGTGLFGALLSLLSIPNSGPAELFSGSLGSGFSAIIDGVATGTFHKYTSDRTAVTLPTYAQGNLSKLDKKTGMTIINALGTQPVFRMAQSFSAQIISSPLDPLDSVTAASPSPVPEPSRPNTLEWATHGTESVSYTTVNQASADATSNTLFVFALLLGVAGAGIIASLQGMIHVFSLDQSANSSVDHDQPETCSGAGAPEHQDSRPDQSGGADGQAES
jgi:hypothetical protein